MYIFVLIIHIVASLTLIAVILLQAGKGGGLAETFGGGSGQTTIFGQKASAFLTKATSVSAVLFLCTSLTLAYLSSIRKRSLMEGTAIPAKSAATLPQGAPSEKQAVSKTTVRQVKVDPKTGRETVIEEKTIPIGEEAK
ncbi:MAG: preprotein translocase subunit SecG [Candidatus Omnitrophica bacterium]|nr:preprotein translocase subunit SecG [Candidatus Omnitrophota bacterium]